MLYRRYGAGLGLILGLLGLCLNRLVDQPLPAKALGVAPLYHYYDYSRAEWGANPLYDATRPLYAPTDGGPFTVTSPDEDTGQVFHPVIQPGQLISTPSPRQVPTGIAIHDTDTTNDPDCDFNTSAQTLRAIQRYHATQAYGHIDFGPGNPDPRKEVDNQGLLDSSSGDMAYHFLIDCAGRIFEGRAGGIVYPGEHVHRHNRGQIAIALIGNFGRVQPSAAQRASLIRLVTQLSRDLNIDPTGVWQQPLLDGTTETLSKAGQPLLNVAGHVDFPDNDHTDPGVLDLNAVRQDVKAQLQTPDDVTFADMPLTIKGPFANYWRDNGALPIFGYPISPVMSEVNPTDGKTYQTQYFERARFELHPEMLGTPYYVLEGILGKPYAARASAKTPTPFKPLVQPSNNTGNYYFPETGHSLTDPFLAYWLAHGGTAIFGLPLSEPFQEDNGLGQVFTVQYFERARFEYHPENPPDYQVLLGLLGTQAYKESHH